MATKTRADLVAQALYNLGVMPAGQDASDEDTSAVDNHVDGVLARLSAKGVVTVTDDNEIPVEWLNTLADLLADDAAAEFGAQRNPQKVLMSENDLRIMARGQPTREVLATDYF